MSHEHEQAQQRRHEDHSRSVTIPVYALEMFERIIGNFSTGPQIVEAICQLRQDLKCLGEKMSQEMDRLAAEVEEQKTVIDSACTAFEGLAEQVRQLKNDPAKLAKFADDLDANSKKLAEAIPVNTPAEPPADPPTNP